MHEINPPSDGKIRFISSEVFIDCDRNIHGEPMFSVFRGKVDGVASFIDAAATWPEAVCLAQSAAPQPSLFG